LHYQTANDTAVAGTDYVAASGSITISPGQTSATIPVVLLADGLADGTSLHFTLSLSNESGATLSGGTVSCSLVSANTQPVLAAQGEAGGTAGMISGQVLALNSASPFLSVQVN